MNRQSCSVGLWFLLLLARPAPAAEPGDAAKLFARENLVAWCIVPFDAKNRAPAERAEMLQRLGFRRFAYDWREQHLPSLETELGELKKRGIELTAVWFPSGLNNDGRFILDTLQKHGVKTQLWVMLVDPAPGNDQAAKIEAAVAAITPIAQEAAAIGCQVGLYNHGGWGGEPENQVAVIEAAKLPNVGIVYNLHHGHDHLDRFPQLLEAMVQHLLCLNLNGMVKRGDQIGKKILPLGQGDLDLGLLRTIAQSGYRGPVGILGHTQDDAEQRLQDNLDGLAWLTPQLAGEKPGPKPTPRTVPAQ
jgi:sugar phosphate isomerase/epimerase